jgi:dUTPase
MLEIPIFKFALTEQLIKDCKYYNKANKALIKNGEVSQLDPQSFLPTQSTYTDTGWDVKCASFNSVKTIKRNINYEDSYCYEISPTGYAKISLGLRVFAPEGWWLKLVPRSSTFGKKNCSALYGVIDQGYEGELLFACQYMPDDFRFETDVEEHSGDYYSGTSYTAKTTIENQSLIIPFGERIAQLIPVRRQEMICESISNEEFDRLCAERGGKRGAGGFGSTSEGK